MSPHPADEPRTPDCHEGLKVVASDRGRPGKRVNMVINLPPGGWTGSAEGKGRQSPGGQGRSVLVLALECKKHLGNKMNEADCKCEPLPRCVRKCSEELEQILPSLFSASSFEI